MSKSKKMKSSLISAGGKESGFLQTETNSLKEPLGRNQAMKLIAEIRNKGTVSWSAHAKKELLEDAMSTLDAVSVLRAGKIFEEPELIDGSYRYRVHTERFVVVVAFASETKLRIITVWRKQQ